MSDRPLRLGVVGLSRGFILMLPTLSMHPKLKVVAGADPRPEARARFAADFNARTYESVEALCRDPEVEAVYIASPHQVHAENAIAAAKAGKHMLVEKPLAITLDECAAMIEAAKRARVHLLAGPSHGYDAPVVETHKLIAGGAYGRLGLITAAQYTDFMYRPRRPEELVSAQGGGVVFSQGAHQVEIVRLLAGGLVKTVRAAAAVLDPRRGSEGAYTAFLSFASGAAATITYSGYNHFDSDELCGWVSEAGTKKDPERYGAVRRALAAAAAQDEGALKMDRGYGGANYVPPPPVEGRVHEHFGFLVASCEKADLRPLPHGVMVYADDARTLRPLAKPDIPRRGAIDELYDTVVLGKPAIHTGEWAMATLEVCLAILRSSAEGREIALQHQVPAP
jgi:phthalate 4,5-cis-dihydrodiol dehydrogenase